MKTQRHRRNLLVVAVAILGLPGLTRGATPPATVSRADLREDVAVLRRAFETVHPGLLRYQTRAQSDARFDQLARELDRDTRRDSVFLAVARFAASVRCGHTHANPYNQGKAVTAEIVNRGGRVPFHFAWVDRHMIVTRDLRAAGKPPLPPGTEVIRMNGARPAQLLARMLPLAAADGHSDARRISQLEVQGRSRYEPFDVLLPLIVPGVEDSLVVEARPPGAPKVIRTSLAPLTWKDRSDDYGARNAAAGAVPWTLDLADSAYALLRMPTWAVYDSGANWDSLLNAMLDRVVASGRSALVVDLRGNSGGLDCGDPILCRMLTSQTSFASERRKVRFRRTPADLDPVLDTWDQRFRDQSARTDSLPDADGFYALRGEDESTTLEPRAPAFRGRLFVLIDAENSSATFRFAQRVRSSRLGTLVGQPTGGNRRGINGGQFFFLRLPHSRIEVDLPVIGYFPPGPQPDAGLVPDVIVTRTVRDLASNRDAELAAVRRILRPRN